MSHAERTAKIQRKTSETAIELELSLDRPAEPAIETGLGFFDHMLTAWATHGRVGLTLRCKGDLHVDDHHTIEDCGLALGSAIDQALQQRAGIERFGDATVPMDEALCRAAIDLSGRPLPVIELGFRRESLGGLATENLTHFFQSLATTGRFALHLDVIRGNNDHHRAEAAFKACAVALRRACEPTGGGIPSTKGTLG
ncbi:MAG: imidazoleglycerol-phosphate dehydratase HisB [Planctomycetota bacterium]